jgi:tetratricopeptide (TPR) repeat protein
MAILEFAFAVTFLFPQVSSSPSDGAALLQTNRPEDARIAFEEELGHDPSNAAAQDGEVAASERIALQARAAGHMDDALQTLLRARSYAPQNARLFYDLGILEDEMRLFQDADKTLSEADRIQPGDARTIYGIARVKLDLGDLAAAEEKMKAYLALRPDDATAHFGLGRIYQIGLQPEKAKVEFLKSAELQPVQTEAYFELGDLALKNDDFDEAITDFAKTLERDPKHGGALEGTGEAYFKKKDFKKAEDFLERAVSAAPDYSPSHYYLGLTLTKLDRKSDAEKELALAAKLANKDNAAASQHPQLQERPATTPQQ